jgi:hypothetical protein
LMRALSVVNCHWTVAEQAFRLSSQAAIWRLSVF